jgi:hypothetical protein
VIYKLEELIIGLLFALISYIMHSRGRKHGLQWPEYFAFGVILLAISHFVKAFFPDFSAPLEAPPRFAGLVIVLYAMLKEVDHPKTDLLTGLGILNGVAYNESALLYFLLGSTSLTFLLFVVLPHYLFLFVGPLVGAWILYRIYKESNDKLALLFSVGFVVYAIANFCFVTALYFHVLPLELYYAIMIVTAAIGVAIGLSI